MTKFAANNNESVFTKLSLYFALKGLHPRINFNLVELSNTSTREQIFQWKALDISGNIKST